MDTTLTNKFLSLGFNNTEITNFEYIATNGGKFTPQFLQQCGYTYEQARRLTYMYNIYCGKVVINSKQDMIKHLRKMFGADYRLSMQDLAISKITNVPRVAVVSNIVHKPYDIWNSNRYKGKDAIYKVVDSSGQKITIETSRKPRLEYGQPKIVPGVLEIKGVKANGNAVVTFDKRYCNLCNRFIIVASLRNPEFHYGKYEMLCFEGTKVYVYATNMGTKENVKYNMGTQRIYAFGIFPGEIKSKLEYVAKVLYNQLHCVSTEYENANSTFKVVEVKQQIDESNDVEM